MKLLKDLRRLSFYRNRSSESQDSNPSSESPTHSPLSSADTSPPSSLLALPDSVQSDNSSSLSFAPIVDNIRHDQTVIYQVVLLEGHIPAGPRPDGTLTLRYQKGVSPPTTWPVSQSRFRAMAYLQPGMNCLTLEYSPSGSRSMFHSTHKIAYQPMTSCPPIKLVLVHAKDSKYAQTDEQEFESTAMLLAKAKYRMAAYIWQSFMAESMNKHGHSRRTFQLENSWEESTLFSQDLRNSECRNQAPIRVLALGKTLAEMDAMAEQDLTSYVEVMLKKAFSPIGYSKQYYACLLLDSETDKSTKAIKRSVAYGGPGKIYQQLNLAIFGGQFLTSYPASLDEVVAAFADSSSMHSLPDAVKWKCASLGIGEHLKQVGYMLGLPEQAFGLMSEDCKRVGYSFNSTQQSKEISLHPLDALRLRFHPAFRAPWGSTASPKGKSGLSIWGTSDNSIQLSSRVGISAVEIYKPGDTVCQHWLDLLNKRGPPRTHVELSFNDISNAVLSLPGNRRSSVLRPNAQGPFNLQVLTADGRSHPIMDVESYARKLKTEIPEQKRSVFTNIPIGRTDGSPSKSTAIYPSSNRMLGITVFHVPGHCVNGIEFNFEEGTGLLIGTRGEDAHKEWPLNVVAGESIFGMEVNVSKDGDALCGFRAHTNTGRMSPWFGAADGETTSYMLIPPETFRIIGMQGDSFGNELHSLQFLLDR